MDYRIEKIRSIFAKSERFVRFFFLGIFIVLGSLASVSSVVFSQGGDLSQDTKLSTDFCNSGIVPANQAAKSLFFCGGNLEADRLSCERKYRVSGSEQSTELCDNIRVSNPTGAVGGVITILQKILDADAQTIDTKTTTELALLEELSKPNPDQERVTALSDSLVALSQNSGGGLNDFTYAVTHEVLDQRPGSAVQHITDTVYAITNANTVNAQQFYYPGTGFQLLQPIQQLWGWSVNFAFGFLILIIIGVALAILFGNSLPAGTTITIQSAIPNIAMALILVPLSYAISGVFIDGVTLGTNVVHGFFLSENAPANEVLDAYRDTKAGSLGRDLYADDPSLIWINNGKLNGEEQLINISDEVGNFTPISKIQNAINDFLSGLPFVDLSKSNWIGNLINLLLQALIFVTSFRIFFKLIKKYLYFILIPPFAPFMFLTVAIPGNGTKVIAEYAKLLGSATAAYVVTYTMMLLSRILSDGAFASSIPAFGSTGYVPPLLGLEQLFTTVGVGSVADSSLTGFILALLAIAVYLNIPKTLESVDEAIGVDNALPSFITNAWESGKDSVNLGKQAVSGLTTAAQKTADLRKLPGEITKRRAQLLQSARNIGDTVMGRRVGEQGSVLDTRRRAIEDRIADLERLRAAERNPLRRQQYNSQISSQKSQLEGINASIGINEQFKEGISGSIKAELVFNGQPLPGGFWNINENYYKAIQAHDYTGGALPIRGFAIRLTADGNVRLPGNILNSLRVYQVKESEATLNQLPLGDPDGIPEPSELSSDVTARDQLVDAATGRPIGEASFAGNYKLTHSSLDAVDGNALRDTQFFTIDSPNSDIAFGDINRQPDGTGKIYELKFILVINNANFIANKNPVTGFLAQSNHIKFGLVPQSGKEAIRTNDIQLRVTSEYTPESGGPTPPPPGALPMP